MTDVHDDNDTALTMAQFALQRFMAQHPGEDVDRVVVAIDAAFDRLLSEPLVTLGDMRRRAAVLQQWFDHNADTTDEGLDALLDVLDRLPETLWNVRIVEPGTR